MSTKKSILQTWQENAPAWIQSIQEEEIKSRKLITNQAILESILSISPKIILDVGCGEGWLCRTMTEKNIQATGIDGIAELIAQAKKKGNENYYTISYQHILEGQTKALKIYNAAVFNYSIFEKEMVPQLFINFKKHLTKDGKIIIQTISPKNELFRQRPADGWMEEKWEGLNNNYSTPFKWYYRSEPEWLALFKSTGYNLLSKKEIIHPETNKNFSVIYITQKMN